MISIKLVSDMTDSCSKGLRLKKKQQKKKKQALKSAVRTRGNIIFLMK